MVRASKPTTTTTPAPVAKKAAAPKKATSKAAPAKAAAPAPVEVAAPAPVENITNEVVAEVSSVTQKMTEFGAKLQQLNSIFSAVKGDFKTLEKVVTRELKAAAKSSAKKAKRAGNRQPSGFVKPTPISDELAKFLGKSSGTEMARTEVSKEINEYIRTHKLQNPSNGRFILADAKLTALLKLQKEDELSYFNLQRYMKHHFIKADAAPASSTA
jgi:chromatin remodeling complex protein RSC6